MSRATQEDYAGWIVEFLKLEKNRPYFIKRDSYFVHCFLCKRRHDGFLFTDYDPARDIFIYRHGDESGQYGVIIPQTPVELQNFLTQCFKRRHVNLKEIRATLDLTEVKKSYLIQYRVTKQEKDWAKEESKKKGLSLSQFAKSKMFG